MARNPIVEDTQSTDGLTTDVLDSSFEATPTPELVEKPVTETPAEPAKPAATTSTLPKKLEGKTPEQIADMYQNLERELGRQANEIGVYRDLVGTLSEVKRKSDLASVEAKDMTEEVTSDDLFTDPKTAIERVVRGALEKELRPLKQTQANTAHQRELERLVTDYPDIEQVGADPQFLEFVQRSEYRVQDAQRWLQTQDVAAARRLLSDWQEIAAVKSAAKPAASSEPVTEKPARGNVAAARRAATESGGNASVGTKSITKAQVMKVLQTDPDRYYSDAFQSELHAAIKEGRFQA